MFVTIQFIFLSNGIFVQENERIGESNVGSGSMYGAGTILRLTEAYGMANALRFAHLHALYSEARLNIVKRLQPRAFHHQPSRFFLFPLRKRHGEEGILLLFGYRNGEAP